MGAVQYFTALLHQEADSAIGLTFPDAPGCYAACDSREGIIAAGQAALSLWFEDHSDIIPAALNAVRVQEQVQAALAEGAVLISIPYR